MSIFPETSETVAIKNTEEESITYSPLFDFKTKKTLLKDGKIVLSGGKEKIKQWIELLIRTEVGKYRVYDDSQHGLADFYNLQGHQLFSSNYGISEMKVELKNKIEAKKEVSSVEDIIITNKFEKLSIELTVIVDNEKITSEVTL